MNKEYSKSIDEVIVCGLKLRPGMKIKYRILPYAYHEDEYEEGWVSSIEFEGHYTEFGPEGACNFKEDAVIHVDPPTMVYRDYSVSSWPICKFSEVVVL